jgi:serine/threonine protein kinase
MQVELHIQPDAGYDRAGLYPLECYAQSAVRLDHPALVKIVDAGIFGEGGNPVLITSATEGCLADLHQKIPFIPDLATACSIVLTLSEALDYLHQQRFRGGHSLSWADSVRASSTADGTWHLAVMPPTPRQIDPAQNRGCFAGVLRLAGPELLGSGPGTPTPASDSFSLAALLFELLTGEPLLQSRSIGEMVRELRAGRFRKVSDLRPDLPHALNSFLARALERHPGDRPSLQEWCVAMRELGGRSLTQPAAAASEELTELTADQTTEFLVESLYSLTDSSRELTLRIPKSLTTGGYGGISAILLLDKGLESDENVMCDAPDDEASRETWDTSEEPEESPDAPDDEPGAFEPTSRDVASDDSEVDSDDDSDDGLEDSDDEDGDDSEVHCCSEDSDDDSDDSDDSDDDVTAYDPPIDATSLALQRGEALTPATPVPAEIASQAQARPAPGGDVDAVDCSVFAPPAAAAGEQFQVRLFAHMAQQTDEVIQLARGFDESARRLGFCSLELDIPQGSWLQVELILPGLEIDEDERVQKLKWQGKAVYVTFDVKVPATQAPGNLLGKVRIYLQDTPIGHIKFKLQITPSMPLLVASTPPPGVAVATGPQPIVGAVAAKPEPQPLGDEARRYRQVFVSYAMKDLNEVMKRVQMLRSLHVNFFQDLLDLEPGERWEHKLYQHIDECDCFMLFWSTASKESKWVTKEVLYALDRQRRDHSRPPEIVPVMIEGPPVPLPNPELAHLHFNDKLLYYMKPLQS